MKNRLSGISDIHTSTDPDSLFLLFLIKKIDFTLDKLFCLYRREKAGIFFCFQTFHIINKEH